MQKTLGNMLTDILRAEEAEKAAAEEARRTKDRERMHQERAKRFDLLDNAQNAIIDSLTVGKKPDFKVHEFVMQDWIKRCARPGRQVILYRDIYEDFKKMGHGKRHRDQLCART